MESLSHEENGHWQCIGKVEELKGRPCRRVYCLGSPQDDLVLIEVSGQFFALAAKCSHMGGKLYDGDVENTADEWHIRCPRHSFKFSITTGKCRSADLQQRTYHVKQEDGEVFIRHSKSLSLHDSS